MQNKISKSSPGTVTAKEIPKFEYGISFLSWAYNEEESISTFINKATELLQRTVSDYEIVIIDDCSTDKTFEILKSLQTKDEHIKLFRNERNLNVGISSQRAIQKATKQYLFWQTVDWCYDISSLRSHLELLKTYDIVQGVRRKPVGEVKVGLLKPFVALVKLFGIKHLTRRSDTIPKAIISVVNYILIRILFRVPLSDYQNVTFYPVKWIQSVNFETQSSVANPEGLIKSYWNGMSIKEVEINFIPRKTGTGKGNRVKAIASSMKDIFRLWFRLVILKQYKFKGKGQICRLTNE